ncbi:MAG: FHA domain-containing protein [Planctomycetota bacterium]|jgi:pSer/pThr/pTyr-binding forkhead associated (FHA) protein
MPKLLVEKGPHAGREFQITDGMVLGRDVKCAVQFMEPEVSRFHVRFHIRPDGVSVEDMKSANGTWLGRDKIDGEHKLKDGDLIRFGYIHLTFSGEDVAPEVAEAHFIKVLDGPYAGREFRVREEMYIGRDKDCDIQLLEAEISRRHAKITMEEGICCVEDLGSSNGIMLNHERVESGEVGPGDMLTVGFTSLALSGPDIDFSQLDIDELRPEGDTSIRYPTPETRFRPEPLEEAIPDEADLTVGVIFLDTVDKSLSDYLARMEDNVYRFQFSTTESSLEKAGEAVAALVERTPLEGEEQNKVVAAIREAVGNAARHGNRYDTEKAISMDIRIQPDRLVISVSDEGAGFDHETLFSETVKQDAVNAARERIAAGGIGGLGFILMKKCVDNIEFNERGNRITLSKIFWDSMTKKN